MVAIEAGRITELDMGYPHVYISIRGPPHIIVWQSI